MRLSLQHLDAITRLARIGSFRDTAVDMGMSQSGLSRTIQSIENRLGVRLFDRDTHRLSLTPAGAVLLPLARKVLGDYNEMLRTFDDFMVGDTGLVRMAAVPSASAVLFPQMIARFNELRPTARFELHEDIGAPVPRAVKDGLVDIAIAPPVHDEDLNYREFLKEEVVLICRSDDPLAAQAEHEWSVFASRPMIALSNDSVLRGMTDEALRKVGVAINPTFICKHPSTLVAFVESGAGIAALTRLAATQFASERLAFRRLSGPVVQRSIGFITHSRRTLSPVVRLVMKELRTEARRLAKAGDGLTAP